MKNHICKISEDHPDNTYTEFYLKANELREHNYSDIYIYSLRTEEQIIDLTPKLLSHESTHLALWAITHNENIVRGLDRLEPTFNDFNITYPD